MENKNSSFLGVLDKNYALWRQTKKSWKYRLKRRTQEVIRAIHKHSSLELASILDIGAAEGAMLSLIKKEFPMVECIGLEYSQELIDLNQDENIKIIQGDAQNLPFKDNSFDIAIATAVIEHLSQPALMLKEAYRVLRKNGLLILTTPVPFFDALTRIINQEKSPHQKTFNVKELKNIFQETNFHVIYAGKFMMSPIGFPGELKIEKIIKFLKLNFVLLNQLIVGKK